MNHLNDRYHRFGTGIRRPQSPDIEHRFQDALIIALRAAFESRGLYQNVKIDEEFTKGFEGSLKLKVEFRRRLIFLTSFKGGGNLEAQRNIRPGGNPPPPPHQIDIGCYLPPIHIHCTKCNRESVYQCPEIKEATGYQSPFFRESTEDSPDTEQLFTVGYQCASCTVDVIVIQLFRRGLKLMVTGRSTTYCPKLQDDWPESIRHIVRDGVAATSEGDANAGYYHLRTALEWHMKHVCKVPSADQIDGASLCDSYKATLHKQVRSDFPSVSELYSELSKGLHARTATKEGFHSCYERLLKHLKAWGLYKSR